MEDKIIYCIQCNKPFVFSAAEQERIARQGFDAPKRCHACRRNKAKLPVSTAKWKDKSKKNTMRRDKTESMPI